MKILLNNTICLLLEKGWDEEYIIRETGVTYKELQEIYNF